LQGVKWDLYPWLLLFVIDETCKEIVLRCISLRGVKPRYGPVIVRKACDHAKRPIMLTILSFVRNVFEGLCQGYILVTNVFKTCPQSHLHPKIHLLFHSCFSSSATIQSCFPFFTPKIINYFFYLIKKFQVHQN